MSFIDLCIKTPQIRLTNTGQIIKNNFHSYFTEKKSQRIILRPRFLLCLLTQHTHHIHVMYQTTQNVRFQQASNCLLFPQVHRASCSTSLPTSIYHSPSYTHFHNSGFSKLFLSVYHIFIGCTSSTWIFIHVYLHQN